MPNDYYSLRDGYRPGVISPVEEAQQRQMLANQQIQAQAQMEALRQQGETSRQGTFDQSSARAMAMQQAASQTQLGIAGVQAKGQLDVANVGQAVPLGELAFQREKYGNESGMREIALQEAKDKADFQHYRSQLQQNMLKGLGQPGGGGTAVAPSSAPGGFSFGFNAADNGGSGLIQDGGSPMPSAAAGKPAAPQGGGMGDLSPIDAYRLAMNPDYDPVAKHAQDTLLNYKLDEAGKGQTREKIRNLRALGKGVEANALEDSSGVAGDENATGAAAEPAAGPVAEGLRGLDAAMHQVFSSATNDVPASTAQAALKMAMDVAGQNGVRPEQMRNWIAHHVRAATEGAGAPNTFTSTGGRITNTNLIRQMAGLPPIQQPKSGGFSSMMSDLGR